MAIQNVFHSLDMLDSCLGCYVRNASLNHLYAGIPKRLFWQTEETQMECSIMLHFIRVCTVCYDYNIHSVAKKSTCDPVKYTMGGPLLIVSICMGKSIRIQRVNMLCAAE